jgi:uncharacterized caspase-like protein/uncharacterized protein (UPF0335 family)
MKKVALLIGVSDYGSGLTALPAAIKDVKAIQEVLEDLTTGGFDDVRPLINPERQKMEEEIFNLFENSNKDDLLLLFFSGHGIKDQSGNLYLAAHNTRKEEERLVTPTAVAATFVQEKMSSLNNRSKRQVVILDCCFSGAFAKGMKVKDDGSIPIKEQLGGEGRAILTSSTSTEYSFAHDNFDLSLYTHFLYEGLKTGVADLDKDGYVSIDELHEYVSEKVQETVPGKMKPEIYPIKEGYKIHLAKVHVDDPNLKYRQEVERNVRNGNFSRFARQLLDIKRNILNINSSQAKRIETEVLKPYIEYNKKLQEYKEILEEEIQHLYPLNDFVRHDLKLIQQKLGLREEDAEEIQQQVFKLREAGILISLGHKILKQYGFEQSFLKAKGVYPPCITYRFKQPKEDEAMYQSIIVLLQRKESLEIYILKEIIDEDLLKINYYEFDDRMEGYYSCSAGIFWVLPSKNHIFVDSLHPIYGDLLKGKIKGNFSLNHCYQGEYGQEECSNLKFSLTEFPINTMNNRGDSYLVVSDEATFENTWKVCIKTEESLKEFIDYLYQKMILQGILLTSSMHTDITENVDK